MSCQCHPQARSPFLAKVTVGPQDSLHLLSDAALSSSALVSSLSFHLHMAIFARHTSDPVPLHLRCIISFLLRVWWREAEFPFLGGRPHSV